jgi:hypothetical protein
MSLESCAQGDKIYFKQKSLVFQARLFFKFLFSGLFQMLQHSNRHTLYIKFMFPVPILSGFGVINTCWPAVSYFLAEVRFIGNRDSGMCFLISAAISVGVKLIAAKL